MLTRSRLAGLSMLGSMIMLASWAGAPAVSAATAEPASPASGPGIPASAGSRLIGEMARAWQITKGEGVTIAVLSTRVDSVSGLSGKLINGPDYAPLAGAPATEGTLLASLIAGSGPTGTSAFATVGRAPGARILAERIVDYGGGRKGGKFQRGGTWQDIMAKAIRYAVNHGAEVIVNDETGDTDTPALDSAVAYAISRNVVVLGSDSSFDRRSPRQYPDSLPGVINFSGTTIHGLPKPPRVFHSPVNNSILVTAPDNILFATGPGNVPYVAYGSLPPIAWVAGTVALIKSVYPHITPALVARALALSASYHPAGGYNTKIGFGLINPVGALHEASSLLKLRVTAAPGPSVVGPGTRFGSSAPKVIDAVRHAPIKLAGFSAAVVVGLVMLVLAVLLGRRRRRPAAAAGGALAADAN